LIGNIVDSQLFEVIVHETNGTGVHFERPPDYSLDSNVVYEVAIAGYLGG
jgi:hypothetical protein